MALTVVKYVDPRIFHDAVIGHLLESEAECCVLIGLAGRMARDGYSPVSIEERDQPILWTVQDGQRIELVAIQTLKTIINIGRGSAMAMECLARKLAACDWDGEGVVGVTPAIKHFVDCYSQLTGKRASLGAELRVFAVDRVIWPKPSTGKMRRCTHADRELLAKFMEGFEIDIGSIGTEPLLDRADRAIAAGRVYFWTDPDPVAMAAWTGPTPNGIRIGLVYTPPAFRGRGYASNLVAGLSQQLLDQGRRFCFLYTDLANPTSNSIYQKIGYLAVSDSQRWNFLQDQTA